MHLKQTVPRPLRGASVQSLEPVIRDLVTEYIEEHTIRRAQGEQLLIYGPEGSGKSYTAAAITSPLHSKGWMIGWVDCNMWPTDWHDADELLSACSLSQALVIDDLGREPKHMRDRVGRMLHSRRESGSKWTVITTNLTVDLEDPANCEIAKTYNRAVRSRLVDKDTELVLMDGRDRRA